MRPDKGRHGRMTTLPPLRDVIARHGLSASKALGQNFLLDGQLLDRIARVPGPLAGETVYEVGPGPGGLTRALLGAGAKVVAVERDRRCLPALAELSEHFDGHLRVIEGDAMAIDERAILVPQSAVSRNTKGEATVKLVGAVGTTGERSDTATSAAVMANSTPGGRSRSA